MNPVLREGNSDRRVANAVKQYAKKHPHSMGAWTKDSKSHVASMSDGDFYANEQSAVIPKAGTVKIEFTDAQGNAKVMKEVKVLQDEVVSATFMSAAKLQAFYDAQVADAKAKGRVLLLPTQHSARFLPDQEPTIRTGVSTFVISALELLGKREKGGAAGKGGGAGASGASAGGNGSGASSGSSGDTGNCGSNLQGRVRDFASSHPDFEDELGDDKGIVEDMLGADGKPVYAHGTMGTATTTRSEPAAGASASASVSIPPRSRSGT